MAKVKISEAFEKLNYAGHLYYLFDLCNRKVDYINVGEDVSFCFLEDLPNRTLYIFFEPSNGKVDWKHNFMFKKNPYKDMDISYKVHRGFLKCWKYVNDIVIEKITEKVKDANGECVDLWKKIITVGYSHGAALAVFCHECIWFHRPDIRDNIFGVGYEGPRVYGGLFVKKSLKERWENFVIFRNHNDAITHLPPKLFGYSHVGHLVKIGKNRKDGPIKDHYPTNVLTSLEEYTNTQWEYLEQLISKLNNK